MRAPHHGWVIKGAVLHLNGEQPLLCDIFELPAAGDVGLRCTNLRMLNGKRPVFVDDMASVFFFPYVHIRFLEIMPGSMRGSDLPVPVEDDARQPVAVPAGAESAESDLDGELEIDEDFLRRIREV